MNKTLYALLLTASLAGVSCKKLSFGARSESSVESTSSPFSVELATRTVVTHDDSFLGGWVRELRTNPSNPALVLAAIEKHVEEFDLQEKKSTFRYPVPSYLDANQVDYSPDGARIAVGAQVENVYVFDRVRQRQLLEDRIGSQIRGVRFSPDGALFAVGAERKIIVYDSQSMKRVKELAGAGNVEFSSDGRRLFALEDGTFQVFEIALGKLLFKHNDVSFLDEKFYVTPDNRFLLTRELTYLQIIDVETGKAIQKFKLPEGAIDSFVFTPNYCCIVATNMGLNSFSGPLSVYVFEVSTGKLLQSFHTDVFVPTGPIHFVTSMKAMVLSTTNQLIQWRYTEK